MKADGRPMTLTRVVLRNYKRIAACEVRLHPLSVLIGRNGAGKSNFLDAMRFVAEALRFSLGHALDSRGAIQLVARRPFPHHPRRGMAVAEAGPRTAVGEGAFGESRRVGIRLDFKLGSGGDRGSYASHAPEFKPAYAALDGMAFYNFNCGAIRIAPGFDSRGGGVR